MSEFRISIGSWATPRQIIEEIVKCARPLQLNDHLIFKINNIDYILCHSRIPSDTFHVCQKRDYNATSLEVRNSMLINLNVDEIENAITELILREVHNL